MQPAPRASTAVLTRLAVLIVALWSLMAGLSLVVFVGTEAGFLGNGVTDSTGQRLAGAHMLVLTPLYLLIAWRPQRYGTLLWLPFLANTAVALAVVYGIIEGDIDFIDGLPLALVSALVAGFLGFVWVTEARSEARDGFEAARERDSGEALGADEPAEP